jgi:mannose-6-phosphate isomerase
MDLSRSRNAFSTIVTLEGRVVTAAWGSTGLLAPFAGRLAAPDGEAPHAEVWFGAHHRNPSWVVLDGVRVPYPEAEGLEQPTFLVKLLAASAPLSIQVHPDAQTAQLGFAAEESSGVARDDARRNFADPSGKPELLRALTPMRVLCGLRSALASRTLLTELAPSGADRLLSALTRGDAALGEVVAELLRGDATSTAALLDAIRSGAEGILTSSERHGSSELLRMAELAVDLTARFPGDPGVLVALLLEDLELAPGEAVFVAPGTPHAYLSGVGVEIMVSSDNVLRGGMTVKPVDVDAFLDVLDATAVGAQRVGTLSRAGEGSGWQRHLTPTDAFVLDEAEVDGSLRIERSGAGPSLLLCVDGSVALRAGDGSTADLDPGGAVLLTAGLDPVEVTGKGFVLHACAGRTIVAGEADQRQSAGA